MPDQGYPSKRHRGRDQPRQTKRSHVQPQQATTSTQVLDPIIPQEYDPASQAINPAEFWGNFESQPMEWQHDGSDKFSSISSPATTYLNGGTPSGDFTGTGGYVMVATQSSGAYSSGSNQTSEDACEQGQQAFYSPPWTPGAGCVIEREALQDFQLPTNDQQQILLHLGSQKLQPVYDPYQQQHHPASGSEYKYTDFENYSYQTSTTESSPPPKTQEGTSDPWNQCDRRVPRYDPSFVAFELSPGPAGTPEAQKNLVSSTRKSRTSQAKSSNRSSKLKPVPGPGRKDKAPSPGWEHIVVRNGGLKIVSENVGEEVGHTYGGRRKGKLEKEAKEKAARVRKVKACWSCWLLKVPCSEGEVCDRCLKHCSRKSFNSASADQFCSRSGFGDFEPTLFPVYLHSHLDRGEIKALIDGGSDGFIGDAFEVEVHTGSIFEPMKLQTHFFMPKGWDSELLKQHHLTVDFEEQKSQFLCRYSAPVGLMSLATSELKKTLREHIEAMVANAQYPAQTTAGDATNVPLLILNAVGQYCRTTDSSLVRSALMLHAIHYFMGTLVTFTQDSAANVYENSPHFGVPQEPYLSSRLLNRQLKFVMHRLHREITHEVLDGLEKSMRSRTKDAWGPSFAAILVLSLCIEGLQTAADTFVVCDMKKEGPASVLRREQSWEACHQVEEYPFQKCTSLFHEIYRSSRVGNGGGREGGFNPLRAMEAGKETGLDSDKPTEELVRDIYRVVYNGRVTLQELSERDAIINWGQEVDPNDIKINNTGRLAAKFLMSFFSKDS